MNENTLTIVVICFLCPGVGGDFCSSDHNQNCRL